MCSCPRHENPLAPCLCQCPIHEHVRLEQAKAPARPLRVRVMGAHEVPRHITVPSLSGEEPEYIVGQTDYVIDLAAEILSPAQFQRWRALLGTSVEIKEP